MDLKLSGRTILITGGTDGLGLALARRLVVEGANVAICGRRDERLRVAQEILGPSALCVQADVTRASDCEMLIAETLSRYGFLDGLVNNAGTAVATPVATSSDEEWRSDYELKVVAALRLARASLEHLEVRGGAILNVLSISARTPASGSTPTSASRAAGLALTKALANEVAPRGIRVNAALIGLVESGQWERRAVAAGRALDEFYAELAKNARIPLGRYGYAEEFADVATFLMSERASYVTGVGISIDGGLSGAI